MRSLLIVLGLVDVIGALAGFTLFSIAWASQYSGFVSWIVTKHAKVAADTPEYEDIRLTVLRMLEWTSKPNAAMCVLLALTGLVLIWIASRAERVEGRTA